MTNIASFNGGMGNDEFLLAEGQYVYSENLDIYRDPRWIQLAVKPTNIVNNVTSLPIQMIFIGQSTDSGMGVNRNTILCLEDKDIVDTEGVIRYPGSTLRPVVSQYRWTNVWLGSGNNLFVMDYASGIMIPEQVSAPASSPTWERISGDKVWTPYTWALSGNGLLNTGVQKPVIRIGNEDFFADSLDIRNIVQTSFTGGMTGSGAFGPGYPTVNSYAQGISQPGENVFMSVHSDSVWSVSKYLTIATSSELSALSLVAGAANGGVKQLQINKNTRFLHGINKSGTDIVVAGDESSRGASNNNGVPYSAEYASVYTYIIYGFGADAQQLITKSKYHENIVTAFGNHGITFYLIGIYGNTDYNWAQTNEMAYCVSNKNDVGLIYAYGNMTPGIKSSWSVIVSKNSQGKALKRIGCLYRHYSKNGFYYSYEDEDGVFGVDYYDDISIDTPTSYQPSGKIFLRTDDGGDMSVEKEVKELRVGCRVPENTTIKISYILDNSGTEIDYATITNTTQGTNEYKKYRGNIPVKGFKCISWFVELTTTGTTTPQLFNFNYDLGIVQA